MCRPPRPTNATNIAIKDEIYDKIRVLGDIYISIDKNFGDWEKASQVEKLKDNENFIALNYPNSSYYNFLQLQVIPRYLIYNKKGEFVRKEVSQTQPCIEVELDGKKRSAKRVYLEGQ